MLKMQPRKKRMEKNANFFKKSNGSGENGKENALAVVQLKIKQAKGSGVLNLSATGLETLTTDLLRSLHEQDTTGTSNSGNCGDDFKWWLVSDLKEVRLSNNKLKRIEDGCFEGLNVVKVLLLDNNFLEMVPDAVWDLRNSLKKLVCSNNNIQELKVNEDTSVPNMVVLDFSHNCISYLPESLSMNFSNLTILDVRNNKIYKFPDTLPTQLQAIHASNNSLVTISPLAFKGLRRLETLDLGHNKLESLPADLSDLVSLKFIDLRYNHLKTIDFSTFPNENVLDQLLTGFNKLVDLNGLDNFSNSLTVLDVRDNKFSYIPDGVLRLCKLKL
mmetsp:Transcript_921/g.1304  ORF Transcript_921/g.1304 Transcript_921/m.1304 type:complete len:330 (+) Transcript_921:166-1155(+)